ncbi:sensor histidine kinase [Acidipropionibacterium timonense]|uniref:sensor histidine kinase n=1 Tax=Acidipropionibacterium timonense TaxID=2161818 RepID=UPI00102F7A5C|nr:sensor histidine kinase [Acidipropionibacterium timonense]
MASPQATLAATQRAGASVRARLTRLAPGRGEEPQISIPGMEEVLDPKIDDGRPVDSERAMWTDLTIVLLLAVAAVVPYLAAVVQQPSTEYIAALVSSLVMVLALLVRRDHPMVMLALVGLGGLLQFVFVPFPVLSMLAVPIASYSVARWVDGRRSRLVLWVGAVGAVLGPTRWKPTLTADYDPTSGTPWVLWFLAMTVCAGLVLTPYAVGRRLRESALIESQQRIAKAQRFRSILAEREQAARVAEERTRNDIARELHDIVAHSLSVMIVQAEGGKALAAKKPEAAAQVLDTIADTGRDALVEMRRIVGVLRQDPAARAEYAPSPGLADIPDLVERSGQRVSLEVSGTRPEVSQTTGLTAYRVVQEGLTNVLKHAGPTAHAVVRVSYEPHSITLRVDDDGFGDAVKGDGRGHGLQGMRERVTSMGGTLEVGPREEGGFSVRAVLPVRGDARR